MSKSNGDAVITLNCGGCGCFVFFGAILGAWLWPYSINTWLIFMGKEAHLVWWQGMLLGFIPGIGQLCVPLSILTWILMMFLT